MKCEDCGHDEKWHYGKRICNEKDDCRLIYQDKENNVKGCECEEFKHSH